MIIPALPPIDITLSDQTGLQSNVATVWVTGWINGGSDTHFQMLQPDGTFRPPTPVQLEQGLPFYSVSSVPSVTLTTTTNGNDRLIFVVAPSRPDPLIIDNAKPREYTAYPYADPPGVAAPGPFDVFEFGYNANADVSAVNGFGLNLSFSWSNPQGQTEQYGVNTTVSRKHIGAAFKTFVQNEAAAFPAAAAFSALLYDGPMSYTPPVPPPSQLPTPPAPPKVDNQYFAIVDPNDMLQARLHLFHDDPNALSTDPLATYWDATLKDFFTPNKYLSINLGTPERIYSGQSTQTGPCVLIYSETDS